MKNNIIISDVAETRWEPYKTTKTRVHETIASIFSTGDPLAPIEEANKVEILLLHHNGLPKLPASKLVFMT